MCRFDAKALGQEGASQVSSVEVSVASLMCDYSRGKSSV
jgi:hypothetical protein